MNSNGKVITDPEKLFHLHKAEWEIEVKAMLATDMGALERKS